MEKKKIIIITSRFPYPLNKGDKLRMYHQIKYISKYHDIYLISLNTEKKIKKECLIELKKYCKDIHIININFLTKGINIFKSLLYREPLQVGYFYSKKAHSKIISLTNEIQPDWIYHQLIRTAKYANHNNNNIIDYMDAFSKGLERRITKFPRILRPLIKREALITKAYETKVFNYFNKHTIITENDRNFIDHAHFKKIKVIPNGVDTQYFKPMDNTLKKYDIVFVGNMSYPPNIEAARYICEEISPIIKRNYKQCKILIGGTNPHQIIKNLSSKHIKVSGWTKDIRKIYASGNIFVAPMFMGTGLQNKLLEAMAMGIPCITTKLANDALLANSHQIIIANNKVDFANACIQILKNKEKAEQLKNAGLKFIHEKYDWKKINNNLSLMFK
ncbi:MAG: hypothetical protein CMP49_02930 [Flavobacteriales bacterium]|nr:hypothetical protein [Flavobacteriales bacterium]